MALAESVKNEIAKGDIKAIRIMMKNSMLVDPSFAELSEMEGLTRGVTGLYDPHDGRELDWNKNAWTEDYMDKMMVQIVRNFSRERIEHLKKVVRHLRPAETAKPKPAASSSSTGGTRQTATEPKISYQEQKRQDEKLGRVISNRGAKIVTGVAAGAVVGGVIAGVASAPVVVGAAAGAAVVGVAVAVTTNGG